MERNFFLSADTTTSEPGLCCEVLARAAALFNAAKDVPATHWLPLPEKPALAPHLGLPEAAEARWDLASAVTAAARKREAMLENAYSTAGSARERKAAEQLNAGGRAATRLLGRSVWRMRRAVAVRVDEAPFKLRWLGKQEVPTAPRQGKRRRPPPAPAARPPARGAAAEHATPASGSSSSLQMGW